ncbi:MAG TPA: tagatose 1,6-diphosphate aldolase [Candidatus Acidoferrum sp.]|nr:tagatose 1,6-diphosphate aldolase [Candidatus Acidoferrum sp.]
MMKNISSGKWKGLEAVSDSRGIIAALAIDQRTALRSLMAKAKSVEPESIPGEMLAEFKEAVSRILTPHATAILLDPEYGLSAAQQRAKNAGLLLAYEQSGYDKTVPGRLPRLLEHWSARRLVDAGADCVKILLYYSPSSGTEINDLKQAWVERIGAECRALDVPFFLELVSYHEGMEDKSREFAKVKPAVVTQSMEEFSKPQYGVDVLKVGVPVTMAYVEEAPGAVKDWLHSREEAKTHFRRAAEAARVPFIYLSEGVSNELFEDALRLAAEAGGNFSGVLCGRATWKDGVPIYVKEGVAALENWLKVEGVKNIQRVNARLNAAKPWFAPREGESAATLAR